MASTVTASSSTAPVTMNLTSESNAFRSIPLEIEPITRAPRRADQAVPRPPNRLVPPMTAAAMAFSSTVPPPEPWLTANRREAAITPPIAASVEHAANTISRIRGSEMPARRAASALPPTAKTCRPKAVRRVMKSTRITIPMKISTASGTPRSSLSTATAASTPATTTAMRMASRMIGMVSSPDAARRR